MVAAAATLVFRLATYVLSLVGLMTLAVVAGLSFDFLDMSQVTTWLDTAVEWLNVGMSSVGITAGTVAAVRVCVPLAVRSLKVWFLSIVGEIADQAINQRLGSR
jgi:hypothetical protein